MVKPANDTKQARGLLGHAAHAGRRTWSPGVTEGFTKMLEITGVGYRAQRAGQEPQAAARLQPRRRLRGAGRHRGQDPGQDHDRDQRHRQAGRSASSPPRSAAGASPSPTRARASSTAASTSSARKGRRSNMAKLSLFDRRRRRVRTALKARAGGRPRLSVHRTGRHIYAQIIDDGAGRTVAAASTLGGEGLGRQRRCRRRGRQGPRRGAPRRPA